MTTDAVWSYKVPGVLCALLAELRGKVFHCGDISNEMAGQSKQSAHCGFSNCVFLVGFPTPNNRASPERETLESQERDRSFGTIPWPKQRKKMGGYIPATLTFSEFVALGVAVLVPLVRLPPVPL